MSNLKTNLIIFEDKPILLTMISGGTIIAILGYFIVQWFLTILNLQDFFIIRWFIAILIILLSIRRSLIPDVQIKININSGSVFAKSRHLLWEGDATEPKKFLVMQKQTTDLRDRIITNYKLFLELHDNSIFEIPLKPNDAKKAIEAIEQAQGKSSND